MFLILLFPYLQSVLNFSNVKPLQGAITMSEDTIFTFKEWFSGHYQEKKEAFLNENFGYRNIFVRLNNQLAYWMFNKAKANGIVVGKKNYLYEKPYIESYFGKNFIGEDAWKNKLNKLKFIQDSLAKLNKTVILIFSPGKASFYSEYIPDSLKSEKKVSNYDYASLLANKMGINAIYFNSYFKNQKNKSLYALYPKLGIHWSHYGAMLAADSIIKYIETKRNISMPKLYWDTIETTDKPKYTDADIADGMNLLFDIKSNILAYPKNIKIKYDEGNQKPSLLVISDSYYWGICNFRFTECFSENKFWYYNKQVFPESFTNELKVEELKKIDVILIMSTESNLHSVGWDFIENVYNALTKGFTPKSREFWNEVKRIKQNILNNDEWKENIQKKAIERGLTLDSMMTLDAIWMIQNQ